jgi:SAM-dependent methyltransferase
MTGLSREPPMNCPVCEANALPRKLAGFDAFVCGCGFIFAGAGASSSAPELYDREWSKETIHPTYVYANGRFIARNRWKHHALLDRLQPFQRLNRILDVGCSAAFFLRLAKDRGWNVQGVEIAEWAANFSRDELDVPTFQGMLHAAAFPSGSFDVAFSSHVLEHIEQPKSFIGEMNRVLRPGGALVIIVPTQFRSPTYLLFNEWFGDGPPRHVSFFDRRSLTRLLEETGFSVVHCGHNIELHMLLKRLRRKGAVAGGTAAAGAAEGQREPKEPGVAIRFAKRVTNALGARLDVSDELCVIAVKQEG